MNRIAMVLLVIICLASGAGAQADESGVLVEVTAGEAAVTDWVVEQMLDLATAAQLLGYQGVVQPADVRVVEVDGQGNDLGVVASQVDPAEREGEFVVTWVMPGQTQPGATRYFSLRLQDKGEVPVPQTSIRVSTGEDTITVRNGLIALEHQRGIGGMIREVTVGGTTGAFTWNDKAYDGAVYYLANHRASEMKVVADGPLRAVVETQGEYLDDSKPAASHPRARYRFTTYAGQPVTHVEAAVTQDFAKQWGSLHFIEIQIGEAPVDSCVTDSGSAVLQQAGRSYDGDQWAAVYGDNLLIGVANGSGPGVWDGGGQHYGAYLRAGTASWNTSYCPWQATLFWGAGRQDIQRLKSWSAIMASPPTATVHLPPLDNRLAQANSLLTAKERQLATLEGEQWAAAHVAALLARAHLAAATTKAAAGSFGPAQEALDRAEAALSAQMGESDLEVTDGVMAGLVAGHPYLGNRKVAFVWSRPEDGAGLLSVYDRRARHEFLKVNPTAALLWQIAVKKGEGGESYSNVGVPCIVTREGRRLDFVWGGGMEVRVRATLNRSETVARLRLEAAPQEVGEGLLSVTFPAVKGILPLTQNAKGDVILDTRQLGWERPSPLHSGNVVDTRYPYGMQFSAIVADGRGLYFAEEDPEANRKNLTWSGQQQTGTLDFTITHPVLGWGGPELVKHYTSPGDIVIGPFHGDWYDAARLYRKWALTAPWCAKGPIYERKDYPQWFADVPYWTTSYFDGEYYIEEQINTCKAFDLPLSVTQVYCWSYAGGNNDRAPEVFPPKLGSEGFKQSVERLQQMGTRVVPYVNAFFWDSDTESYHMENAEQGAIRLKTGEVQFMSYDGQRIATMCPGSALWRDKLTEVCKELVGRYGVDGIYLDFLTIHGMDCFNPDHGHPLGGGNYWTKSVRELYGHIRHELKQINPEVILTGERTAEYVIDLLDAPLSQETVGATPLFQAVYHGYALAYGGQTGNSEPHSLGRWWLMGNQNGWNQTEFSLARALQSGPEHPQWQHAQYYLKLLRCHYHFARPYLAYGEMLRPPRIDADLPTVTGQTGYGPYTVPVVEGSAWRAPDGSVGVFLLNYDKEQPHEFSWTVDLREGAGWGRHTRLKLSEWTEERGLKYVGEVPGGRLTRHATIEPWGLIALKIEAVK